LRRISRCARPEAGGERVVFTLRCTGKLLRRLGATPSSEVVAPTTVLGDWCCTEDEARAAGWRAPKR
jgi:hypothetical protein